MSEGRDSVDVLVVGGRCAGAALATWLARAGLHVRVVDQARFPSDTASTHVIQPSGVKALERLGVLPEVRAVSPAIDRSLTVVDRLRVELEDVGSLLGAPLHNIRRVTLDQVLLTGAAAAGADVATKTAVTGLLEDNGRVCGVRTSRGDMHARLVVGADGVRSTVARLAGAREYHRTNPGRIFVWGYFEGVSAPHDLIWFGKQRDHGYLASHTDGGRFMAVVAFPRAARHAVLADRAGAFQTGLAQWPELRAAVGDARRVGPLRTVADWHGYFRSSAGRGWALVGDAGHFKDPTPGQGIADALRQAENLAPAIASGLEDGNLHAQLVEWWRWRDRDAWDMYWFARRLGAEGPTPTFLREVLRHLSEDGDIGRFFQVLDHVRPASELAPASLALRAAASGLRQPDGGVAVLRQLASFARDDARHRRMLRELRSIYSSTAGPATVTVSRAAARRPAGSCAALDGEWQRPRA